MYKKRCLGRQNSLFSRLPSDKKGQITVFMILGILFLLILVLIIAYQQEIIVLKPGELVMTEKGKITQLIVTCMDQLGDEALTKIGFQGGYIEVPDYISKSVNRRVSLSPFIFVPYWAFGDQTEYPTLEEIKEDIDDYIEGNLRNCVFQSEPFKENYDVVERSQIYSDTNIAEDKVLFNVNWNVEVSTKDGSVIAEIINYISESPIKLKKVYEMATIILDKEMEELKLEDITQDLLALEHPKIPLTGFEMSCSRKKWKIDEVKENLQEIIRINIGELKVEGTNFVEFPEELPYYKNHYIWDLGENVEDPNIFVHFDYQKNFPFFFAVGPKNGNYLKSNQVDGGKLYSLFCMQNWKFIYDLSYPVVVNVVDETTGYTFKMAMTVHLQDNYPNKKGEIHKNKFSYQTYNDEEFCADSKIDTIIHTYELIENQETGIYSREPLEDVDVSFNCLRLDCPVGKTQYDYEATGDIASYRTYLPYCVGGIVKGNKDGYKEGWERIVTEDGKEVELNLIPEFSVPFSKFKVVKHYFLDKESIGLAENLAQGETVSIKLKFDKEDALVLGDESFHESSLYLSPDVTKGIQGQQGLDFLAKADFNYDLEINIFKENKIVGGYKGKWPVSWDSLSQTQEIVFHTLITDKTSDVGVYDFIENLEDNSKLIPIPEVK